MVQTLEAIKGGGGSVHVGATGTIGSLMTREMESMMKQMAQTSTSSRRRPPTVPVSVPCGAISKKTQPRKNSLNEASSSGGGSSSSSSNDRNTGCTEKAKSNLRTNDHHIPMLSSGNIPAERNPNREKPDKKGSYIVEVVDIKCGNPDRAWTAPITTRLKKLGFSKLSETVA
ncbi:uncharacterized protein LOC131221333 [Magnolia sinica]|uniref:uncharacterized protein LOC131221333 n=1 Tax=Magnolia sinica TaxID=86752 RepID=UPI00265B07E1|nr:uncharacterized protein LOC131221333 [Magnolia sinica]XP_058072535.1 uncharacterized protein LOC131221333 [Magnolia sinica]XP_058072536.1 uncharacterized protein LOC131221333 [Magnolia sinica]XP_058072537.1 uncharacterized protein LOC131221333 [Magnolia sinica]XP_058072538.1 uncharacterized protein LOC131221333 [Magnolia sinica]XP_058072539.1 uncharacterized protein LOC131221333 [Magnolia sinica]XP_058072540.1 uncharacterized protein LOC131221333 [Magnolia sinica]